MNIEEHLTTRKHLVKIVTLIVQVNILPLTWGRETLRLSKYKDHCPIGWVFNEYGFYMNSHNPNQLKWEAARLVARGYCADHGIQWY